MIELIKGPWHWAVAGTIIAIVYFLLLYFGKSFGISATLRAICSALGAGKRLPFFDFNWRDQVWNLMFVMGAVIGGFIATQWLSNSSGVLISEATQNSLNEIGITSYQNHLEPIEFFNWESLFTVRGFVMMVIGGFCIGFGSRYSGGCTSGHAISGLANLQLPSLIAVIGFFIGGLISTWLLLPLLLTW